MKPVTETQDVVTLITSAIEAYRQIMADKKMTIADLGHLLALQEPATKAMHGINDIPAELLDMDSQDFALLSDQIRDVLHSGVDQDAVSEIAIECLNIISSTLIIKDILQSK